MVLSIEPVAIIGSYLLKSIERISALFDIFITSFFGAAISQTFRVPSAPHDANSLLLLYVI